MSADRKSGGIPFYLTGPHPHVAKELGFWGGKVSFYTLFSVPAETYYFLLQGTAPISSQ